MSTPAGRSSLISVSIVFEFGVQDVDQSLVGANLQCVSRIPVDER